jgi:hypothetical protein
MQLSLLRTDNTLVASKLIPKRNIFGGLLPGLVRAFV